MKKDKAKQKWNLWESTAAAKVVYLVQVALIY